MTTSPDPSDDRPSQHQADAPVNEAIRAAIQAIVILLAIAAGLVLALLTTCAAITMLG